MKIKIFFLFFLVLMLIFNSISVSSDIIVDNANSIWMTGLEDSSDLYNTIEGVDSRIIIDNAEAIYLKIFHEPKGLFNLMISRIIVDNANSILKTDLQSPDFIQLPPSEPDSQPEDITPTEVPFFSQRDNRWKEDYILDVNEQQCGTIGEYLDVNDDGITDYEPIGCTMTCTAMLLKYYEVNTDPEKLNTWLNANNGYASGGYLFWNKPAEYSSGKMQYMDSLSNDIVDNWNDLKNQLDQGFPVIVEVDSILDTEKLDSHWVLVTSFNGGEIDNPDNYYINDPWVLPEDYDPEKKLSFFYDETYENTFFAMRVYHGSPSRKVSENGENENGGPGFELIFVVLAFLLILFCKRKRKF